MMINYTNMLNGTDKGTLTSELINTTAFNHLAFNNEHWGYKIPLLQKTEQHSESHKNKTVIGQNP